MARLITTGVDQAGCSRVLAAEELPAANPRNVASFGADPRLTEESLAGVGADEFASVYEPPPGLSWTVIAQIDPRAEDLAARRRQPVAGLDEEGFHVTRTLDYVYVIDGPLFLDLETESVEVFPGDVVVQQATRHAWRNLGERPVRMFTVMVSCSPRPEPDRRL